MSASRRFAVAGFLGLGIAVLLSVVAWFVPTFVPALITPARAGGSALPRLVLLGLGFIAVAELPLMLIVLVRLARGGREGQRILELTHLAYVAFPAIYGLLGTGLTGERWWALVMFGLTPVRLIMSLLGVSVPPPERGSGLNRQR
jgi:hypothetical protein